MLKRKKNLKKFTKGRKLWYKIENMKESINFTKMKFRLSID